MQIYIYKKVTKYFCDLRLNDISLIMTNGTLQQFTTQNMSCLFSFLCPPQSNTFPMQMTIWHQNPRPIILLSTVDLA